MTDANGSTTNSTELDENVDNKDNKDESSFIKPKVINLIPFC